MKIKSIKKNDSVAPTIDVPYNGYNTKSIPAGTTCQVRRVSRKDGTAVIEVTDEALRRSYYGYARVNINNLKLLNSPIKPNVKVGDIYVSCWGYDQTNVDFYQVVDVLPNSVRYVPMSSNQTYTGPMQGTSVPTGATHGDTKMARIKVINNKGDCCFKLTSYSNAYKWKGEPVSFTEWH
jgi:hypothetical protein